MGRLMPTIAGGFSIVEVLATMAFVSIGVLALSASAVSITRANAVGANVAAATALAQAKLEELRSLPLGSPQLSPGTYAAADNPLAADGRSPGPYTLTWSVSDGDEPQIGLRTVTVEVAWHDYQDRRVLLAAYVRCPALPCP